MNDPHDFTLPAELGPVPALEGPPAEDAVAGPLQPQPPAPMIVVQYRQPGFLQRLTTPLLILAAAVAVLAYQRQTPPRPLAEFARANVPARPTDAPRIEVPSPPVTPPAPARNVPPNAGSPTLHAPLPQLPIELAPTDPETTPASEPPPAPAPVVDAAPNPTPASSPFDLGADSGLEPLPIVPVERQVVAQEPSAPPAVEPLPPTAGEGTPLADAEQPTVEGAVETEPAGAKKDEILDDIRREAEEKQAQQQEMAELKPKARAMLLAESLARIQSNRGPFRDELRALLKTLGPDAAAEIENLCNRFGRDMPPEAQAAYYRALRRAPRRMSTRDEVDFMRTMSVPEPMIVDFLAHKLHKTINTRGGPRDENEVRVKAAQLLLTFPSVPPGTVSSAIKPAPNDLGLSSPALSH